MYVLGIFVIRAAFTYCLLIFPVMFFFLLSFTHVFKECSKRVVLKIIFIFIYYQKNEVFHKIFVSPLGKVSENLRQSLQNFNKIVLFYLRSVAPAPHKLF